MSSPGVSPSSRVFDVGPPLENGRWNAYQKLVLALVAMAVVLDGFDNQVLGFALPALVREWNVDRAVFAPVFALGFLGMALGTGAGGWLGDRIGRKPALILSVLVFGVGTGFTAIADDVFHLGICRVIAGFGLGGAMPCATTLIAEFSPVRRRSLAVTLGIVCIPLGGVVGGLIAARVLPTIGWRALFAIAGVMPIAVAVLLLVALPESPKFLVGRRARRAELARTLTRLGCKPDKDVEFVNSLERQADPRGSLRALFNRDYRRDSLALWTAFFFCLLSTYIVFSWAPSLLAANGFDLATSSTGLAVFNIGGVIGAIAGAVAVGAMGSRVSMLMVTAGGTIGAVILSFLPLGAVEKTQLLTALFIEGAFINAAQTTLYALTAQVYPVQIRAIGVGSTAGFGRLGAIASSFIGAGLVAGGGKAYFGAIALTMGVTFVALAFVRRHTLPLEPTAALSGIGHNPPEQVAQR